jgi:hypothetical protein
MEAEQVEVGPSSGLRVRERKAAGAFARSVCWRATRRCGEAAVTGIAVLFAADSAREWGREEFSGCPELLTSLIISG